MAKRIITKRIGEVLLERGLITRKKLEEALDHQKEHGGLMGQVLIKLGMVTEEDVALALPPQNGFPQLPVAGDGGPLQREGDRGYRTDDEVRGPDVREHAVGHRGSDREALQVGQPRRRPREALTPMATLKERIMDALLQRSLVTPDQLNEVLAVQRTKGGSLQEILVKRGLVKEDDLLAAVSQGLGVHPISLSRMRLDPSLKTLVPRDMAVPYQLIPVACIGQTLTVAMADPLNVFALDTIATLTGLHINPLLTTHKDT